FPRTLPPKPAAPPTSAAARKIAATFVAPIPALRSLGLSAAPVAAGPNAAPVAWGAETPYGVGCGYVPLGGIGSVTAVAVAAAAGAAPAVNAFDAVPGAGAADVPCEENAAGTS